MSYTTEIIEIRVILFFCLSVSLFPTPTSLSLPATSFVTTFFYFYKKDLMFAMFMHKYDQGQNFKYVKS